MENHEVLFVCRELLTPSMFYEDPSLYCLPYHILHLFKFCPTPILPCCLSSLLFVLFFLVKGDCATFDVLIYLMVFWVYTCWALYLSTRRTLLCVYATKHQVYWGMTHNVVFCWYSDLISETQKHTHKDKQHNHGPIN